MNYQQIVERERLNAPIHSVWCTCHLCVEWVARQPKKTSAVIERERMLRRVMNPRNQSWRSRVIGGFNRLMLRVRRIYG